MNDLRTLLRQHDPAASGTLADHDRHRIRAAMFAAAGTRPRFGFLRPIFVTLTSLVVLATIAFGVVRRGDAPAPEPRRVEYTTPGGTRVIWTLDPSFQM
ncbi:MAG: hypothetical protein ACXW5U_03480 [Thermoanaerobaculia bacterium]